MQPEHGRPARANASSRPKRARSVSEATRVPQGDKSDAKRLVFARASAWYRALHSSPVQCTGRSMGVPPERMQGSHRDCLARGKVRTHWNHPTIRRASSWALVRFDQSRLYSQPFRYALVMKVLAASLLRNFIAAGSYSSRPPTLCAMQPRRIVSVNGAA